jgi:hypothetical protein
VQAGAGPLTPPAAATMMMFVCWAKKALSVTTFTVGLNEGAGVSN